MTTDCLGRLIHSSFIGIGQAKAQLKRAMSIDLNTLGNIKQHGDKIIARCPACADIDRDRSGDHLVIFPDGRFACAAFAGDHEHRQRIHALAGMRDHVQSIAPSLAPRLSPIAPLPQLPPDFASICQRARGRVYNSTAVQQRIADEFGISPKTAKACAMPAGGALGFFPHLSIQGKACLPDRIAYLYPHGIKVRQPWGNLRARFAWAYGKATEPWRYTVAAWRPWITRLIVTEGESDALALIEVGMGKLCQGDTAVVASPGTSFPMQWAPLFAGRRVTLCFDQDEPGTKAAHHVASMLQPHAISIEILTGWEGLAP